jgi:hypothetical protein
MLQAAARFDQFAVDLNRFEDFDDDAVPGKHGGKSR